MVAGANPGFRIFTGLGNGKFKGSSIYSADTYNFLTGDFNGTA